MSTDHYCDEHDVKLPNYKSWLWHIKEVHLEVSNKELEKIHEY